MNWTKFATITGITAGVFAFSALIFFAITAPKVVSQELINTSEVMEGRSGCSYSGYCYGMKFDGTYGWGLSGSCSGNQDVTYVIETYHQELDNQTERVIKWKKILTRGECD